MIARRAFLKAAAALPAAAIVPAALVAAPVAEAAPAVAAAVIDKHPWKWWISTDGGEEFFESFASREEAVAMAHGYGGATIAECKRQDFDLSLDADFILSHLSERADDDGLTGESGWMDVTDEQARDLSKRLTAAMYQWVEDHKINAAAWVFGEVRAQEKIP